MTEATSTTNQVPFGEMVNAAEEAKKDPAKYQVPLKEERTSILLNVEVGVKDLVGSLARKEQIEGIDLDPAEYAEMPNSFVGVVMYLVTKGLKAELDIEFDNAPKSLKQRGNSALDKKIEGKKRLLTRDEKNELLSKTQMSYYEKDIAMGKMTIDQVLFAIKDAYARKKGFEDMGYMLPEGKTKYPYWIDEEVKEEVEK